MPKTVLTIVLSQGQSRAPEKRALEEAISTAAAAWDDVRVYVIPHLYDLTADGPSIQKLRAVGGPLAVLSWMFERPAHWVLDRLGVHGQLQPNELAEVDEADEDTADAEAGEREAVLTTAGRSERPIWCIDLRAANSADRFTAELRRIADECAASETGDSAAHAQAHGGGTPAAASTLNLADLLLRSADAAPQALAVNPLDEASPAGGALKVEEHPSRRWYPVIDFSRCTNCMECIDFCLFGVYGVDGSSTILVEQPDNCRKGCPACSRVCPANAIMFPQHKTPAIAGAAGETGGFKIDLSKLFGAPAGEDEDPMAVAARERDEQLLLAGRAAVGSAPGSGEGVATRTTAARATWTAEPSQRDGLDDLVDSLDGLDL